MAMDETILESVGAGDSLPTLRLFAWTPPCLSLGFAQPLEDVNLDKLNAMGWDIVRRMTGGRAILHTDELTYSVICPIDEPRLAGGVLESYLRLSHALLNALKQLGVTALALPKGSDGPVAPKTNDPVCFEVPSNYEITVNGKKLVGSAQARKKTGILQHGTLPLHGDLTRILDILNHRTDPSEEKTRLLHRATTLERVLNSRVTWEEAASAFVDAFKETLNLTFKESEPSKAELERIDALIEKKYAHPSWTRRI